ncbi:hypothetical protein BDV39DRAFT_206389 [Aspergillus sergii]|uniref:Fungal N-terminal domain-containing protein n=1 Tax=Aspergillus sergii TaxID=1034303 RepID=A0A5N6X344_9EURO|nr:hypothetical protein BDV39DRAFT_206389 [Aspergillus sergii]
MQFKISTLTALLAASTSVSAGTISGDQVIEVLDSLTNQVGDLNSKLQSTEDPITLSQELLSSEKDIAALELGEIIINSAEPTLFPATQLDVCQAIITFIDVDTGFLRFLVGDGSFITPDLKPTQAVLRSLGSIVDVRVSYTPSNSALSKDLVIDFILYSLSRPAFLAWFLIAPTISEPESRSCWQMYKQRLRQTAFHPEVKCPNGDVQAAAYFRNEKAATNAYY